METGLKNRVAMVAASSQGIGRATAEAFAAEGCRVAMCARNSQTLQQAAVAIRRKYSSEVFSEALDVTDAPAVHQFVEGVVAKFGSADICVNNTGGPPAKGCLGSGRSSQAIGGTARSCRYNSVAGFRARLVRYRTDNSRGWRPLQRVVTNVSQGPNYRLGYCKPVAF